MRKSTHVLLADDDKNIRQTLALMLRQDGFHVSVAENGVRAMEIIQKGEELNRPVDYLVLDIVMPRMKGVDLVKEMRARDIHIPVLGISGNGTKEVLLDLSRLGGCVGFMVKPFDPALLIRRIRGYFSSQRRPSAKKVPAEIV